MSTTSLKRLTLGSALLASGLSGLLADPAVTRLNPPSALFTFGDENPPYVARFAVGQRFDLQATIQADTGKTITAGSFSVNGTPVAGTVTITPIGNDRFSLALRAYSNTAPGAKILTINAVQDDAKETEASGNFEIIGFTKTGKKAKNLIYIIGDGTGIAHRTAARLVTGNVQQGKVEVPLAIDTLPVTGVVMTPSLDAIVTDSAPGAACYSTGNKSNNNQEGVFPDDTSSGEFNKWDNPRVEHLGSYLARTQGKALGIVTTADVEDATPAAFAVHAQDRGAGTGIVDMYLDEAVAHANLRVLMGGGRRWFLPQAVPGSGRVGSTTAGGADYVLPADVAAGWGVPVGAVDPDRNLIADFQAVGFKYVATTFALNAVPPATERLLGLFHTGNMDIALDKLNARRTGAIAGTIGSFPYQPMLEEMTEKALQVLSNNEEGFVLMVEAASVDKQAHNMDSERWILDAVEMDRAVAKCIAFQEENPDTLIIVTADHECAGINIIGSSVVTNANLIARSLEGGADGTAGVIDGATGPSTDGQLRLRNGVVGTYQAAGFPQYTPHALDGYPETLDVDYKILIGYAANGDRYEDWLTNPEPNVSGVARDRAGDYFITGQATGPGTGNAVHTASDIPLSAGGRGAALFTGVQDNTDVFFKALQAVVGGAK